MTHSTVGANVLGEAKPETMVGQRWLLRFTGAVIALLIMSLGGLAHESSKSQFVNVGSNTPASQGSPAPGASPGSSTSGAAGTRRWLSGAGGKDVADGAFARWRGEPLTVAGTWDDDNARMVAMRSFCEDWKGWNKPIDVAIGALDRRKGESWAAAAKGAYDARWRKTLQKMKSCWGSRDPGNIYIRFAHEYNIKDMKWRVMGGEEALFVKAITRFSDLRYSILPQAKIVLCPSDGTSFGQNIDLYKTWPGKDGKGRLVANVYGIDTYNSYVVTRNAEEFSEKLLRKQAGMPLGMEYHRLMAKDWGVPFVISEWGANGDPKHEGKGGDYPVYMQLMHEWFKINAGDPNNPEPGKLLYEIYFNDMDHFMIYPTKVQPKTAAEYRKITWGK
jgi:hypothetical protein